MRPVIWVLLYVVSIILMLPAFSAILYAKEATQHPKEWTENETYRREAKVKAWATAMLLAPVWPVSLVGMSIYMIFRAFDRGMPKEIREQLRRKRNRDVIREYDEEQVRKFEE